MPITSSPSASVIAFTPRAVRPMGRTSLSLNRIAMPLRVATTSSRSPSVRRTQASSSPSSSESAITPPLRAVWNAESSVRLIVPPRVTITR